ncbi:hypothetical protein Sste5346_002729 [Sporothrix stenoceras]|uniref:Chromatin remodeling complex subunit n=1 Tax=Sporothrix stenoceras TaxID=5173 RepID=A0ABR3ZJ57_9PEZI
MSGMGDDDDPFALFGRGGGDGSGVDDHQHAAAGAGMDGPFAVDADSFFETNGAIIDPANLWGNVMDFDGLAADVEGVEAEAGGEEAEIDEGDNDDNDDSEVEEEEEEEDAEDGAEENEDGDEDEDALLQAQLHPPPIISTETNASAEDNEDDNKDNEDEEEDEVEDKEDGDDGEAESSEDEQVVDEFGSDNDDPQDIPTATVEQDDNEEAADAADAADKDAPLPIVVSGTAPLNIESSNIADDVQPSSDDLEAIPPRQSLKPEDKKVSDKEENQDSILMTDQFGNKDIDDSMLDSRRNLDEDEEYEDDEVEDDDDDEEEDVSMGEANNEHANENGTGRGAIDADLVIPGDGSRVEVIINPLPESRHEEYEVCPPSNYVYRVIARVRGRSRYEIEYDDGGRFEFYEKDIYDLPNGSKALHKFKRRELEDVDELSSAGGSFKRRRIRHNGEYTSDYNDMSFDAGCGFSPGSLHGFGEDDDDIMDLDLDNDSIESQMYLNMQRRRLRAMGDTGRSGIRYSSRLVSTANEDDSDEPGDGRRLRDRTSHSETQNGRSHESSTHRSMRDDDTDELGGEDDADFIPTIQSDLQPQKSGRGRGRGRRRINALDKNRSTRDGSIEFERMRRSSRANRNTRSMVDPTNYDDDAFLVEDDRTPAQPRIINVKEVFIPLDEPSAFRDAHMQICNSCGGPARTPNKGIMIYCQGCSLSFHKQCIGLRRTRDHMVTKVAEDSFVLQCKFCVGQAQVKDPNCPRHDKCQKCSKIGPACAPFSKRLPAKQEEKLRLDNDGIDPITPVNPKLVDNADYVLFRCTDCRRGFHFEHLPPPSAGWTDSDNTNIRKERMEEYLIDGKCRECLDMTSKIEGLIAWRPVKRDGEQANLDFNDIKEDDKEYLIKWEDKSHNHCEWRPGAWVWGVCHNRMRLSFGSKNGEAGVPPVFEAKDAIPEEYLLADIVLMVRYNRNGTSKSKEDGLARINDVEQIMVKFQGLGYDAAVWDAPPPQDSGRRWKAFVSAYDEYLNGKHFKNDSQYAMRQRVKEFTNSKKFEIISEQPAVLRRGKLMPYQMEGLNWLLLNYYKGKSVVLADEMGLGKTVQVIALLATLVLETPRCWPFLVVVPNSTCGNWRREIKNWAPDLRVVSYHGGRVSQSMAYKYELFPDGTQTMRAHVVIMSYDSAQDDNTRRLFHNAHWAGLIVDEGQRLKNDQNLLYLALRAMRISFRLLLTGTPLQNNKRELFNLLQFIDSSNNATELDKTYSTITAENLPELHKLIRPYFLRRTKAEVLKFLPPMAQIIVPVSMTVVQEKLCKSIMAKNPQLIRSIFSETQVKATERGSLNNILMQLRKCLCHPFVYSQAIEDKNVEPEQMHRNLIEASSKLLLLKIMLPKLKERGHRVLIFSQFLNQLDIIEDFLHISGLTYMRLDGSISSLEKQKRIDAYNAPDSDLFAFLLSTRAGGVGINLATADTVIVLDPDFNPHQDIQAFSRAHRIGQKKKVLCFQFMTKDSVEEKIMQIGRSKMALDHALIETMDAEDDAGNDLESILRHGAEALFSEEAAQNRIVYDNASVDKLLDRSQVENTKTDDARTAESQFSFARVWANETGSLADDIELTTSSTSAGATNAAVLSVWDKIISEREAEAARLAEAQREVLGRGGRRRNQIKYTQPRYNEDGEEAPRNNNSDGSEDDRDGEFSGNDNASSSDDEEGSANDSRRRSRGQSTANLTAEEVAAEIQGTTKKSARIAKRTAPTPKKATLRKATFQKTIAPKKTVTKKAAPPLPRPMKKTATTAKVPSVKQIQEVKGAKEAKEKEATSIVEPKTANDKTMKKTSQSQLVAATVKTGSKLAQKEAQKTTAKKSKPSTPPPNEPAAKRQRMSSVVVVEVPSSPGDRSPTLSPSPAPSQGRVAAQRTASSTSSNANGITIVNPTANSSVAQTQQMQKKITADVQWSQVTMPNGAKVWVVNQPPAYKGSMAPLPATPTSNTQCKPRPPTSSSSKPSVSNGKTSNKPPSGPSQAIHPVPNPYLTPTEDIQLHLQRQQQQQLITQQYYKASLNRHTTRSASAATTPSPPPPQQMQMRLQELQVQQKQHHLVHRQQQELQQQHQQQQRLLQQQQPQSQQQPPNPFGISSANDGPPVSFTAAYQREQQSGAAPDADDRDTPYYIRNRDLLNYKRKSAWWQSKVKQIRDGLEALDRQGLHLAATIAHGATTTPSEWAKSGSQRRLLTLYNKRKEQLARIAVLEEVGRQQQKLLFLKKEEHVNALTEYMENNNGNTAGGPLLKDFDTEEMRRSRYNHQTKIPRSIYVLQKMDHKIIKHMVNGGRSVALEMLPDWLQIDFQAIPTVDSAVPPESLEVYLTRVYEKNPQAPTVVAALFVPKGHVPTHAAPASYQPPPSAASVPAPHPNFAPASAPSVPPVHSFQARVSVPAQVPVPAPLPSPSPSLPPPPRPPPAHSATLPLAVTGAPTPTTSVSLSRTSTPGPSSEAKKAKKLKRPTAEIAQPQVPAMAQRMVVQLSMAPIARCRKCNQPHPASGGCANLGCEAGIRLALDALRSSDADPKQKQTMRKSLVAKLGEITSSKKQ